MQLNELTALSPIDGRYRNKTAALAPYLSEWGLMKYRVEVEVEYFIALVGEPALNLPALNLKRCKASGRFTPLFPKQMLRKSKPSNA